MKVSNYLTYLTAIATSLVLATHALADGECSANPSPYDLKRVQVDVQLESPQFTGWGFSHCGKGKLQTSSGYFTGEGFPLGGISLAITLHPDDCSDVSQAYFCSGTNSKCAPVPFSESECTAYAFIKADTELRCIPTQIAALVTLSDNYNIKFMRFDYKNCDAPPTFKEVGPGLTQ